MRSRKPPGKRGAQLSHVGEDGEARMVDTGGKPVTRRRARARARVRMEAATRRAIADGSNPKGAVLAVARIAGIQAAKRTGELIPLCHPLPLQNIAVDFRWREPDGRGSEVLEIEAEAAVTARTGVEMEALVAAAVAALTVYDMCKAADRGMVIESVRLLEKDGGRSGAWRAAEDR